MNQTQIRKQSGAAVQDALSGKGEQSFVLGCWGVRYQFKDVAGRSSFIRNDSVSGSSKRTASLRPGLDRHFQTDLKWPWGLGFPPNGHTQEPGGWNRVILQVADLPCLH